MEETMDHIVLDVEIAHSIEETPGGWEGTAQLGVSVACLWEMASQRLRIYGPDDVPTLRQRVLAADRVTTFNGDRFDLPVIFAAPRDLLRLTGPQDTLAMAEILQLTVSSDDLLRRIWQAQGLDPTVFSDRHRGWGLDAVCEGTLQARTISHGSVAPLWFQAGQWARLTNYCADDVALTRDLCQFIDRYGDVVHPRLGSLAIPPWQKEP